MHKICAWCGNNIADSLDSCPGVSHGMCIECEALLIGDKPGSLRHFLDEIDVPVMAIDKEGQLLTANGRVEKLLHKDLHEIENQLSGDFMECAHAQLPGGCRNTTHCPTCTIRKTVMHTYKSGESQTNVETTLYRRTEQGIIPIQLWITTVKSRDVVILRIEEMRAP